MAVVNDLGYFLSAIVASNSKLLGAPIRLGEIPSLLMNATDPAAAAAGVPEAAAAVASAAVAAAAAAELLGSEAAAGAAEPAAAAPPAPPAPPAGWLEAEGSESEGEDGGARVSVELVPRALLTAKSVEDAAVIANAWARRAAALAAGAGAPVRRPAAAAR
jgi:hypothetical protein